MKKCFQQRQKVNRPSSKKRTRLLWGGLFCITVLLQAMARLFPDFAEWYALHMYPLLVGSLGRFSSLFPFSLSELLLAAMLAGLLIWLLAAVRRIFCRKTGENGGGFRKRSGLAAGKLLICLFFLFTINCGINYHRMTFSERAGFEIRESTKEELAALCLDLTEEINEEAPKMKVDEQGGCRTEGDLASQAREAMAAASETYPELSGYYPRAKAVRCSWVLSYQQLQGVYSPFTIESNYNRDMPDYNKPSTICHELSHLRGFMREDEANFIAYLACRASEQAQFRYSGSMLAYVYSMNALYREDRELFGEIRSRLCEQADRDLRLHNAFWDSYDGAVAEVSDKVNDTYLKANAQADGTKSYGRMVDLLLAFWRAGN